VLNDKKNELYTIFKMFKVDKDNPTKGIKIYCNFNIKLNYFKRWIKV